MGNTVRIAIPSDGEGYIARECPACDGFFKVTPGTGRTDTDQCFCPYCGHRGPADTFWTSDQIEYAKTVLLNRVAGRFVQVFSPQEADARASAAGDPAVADRTTRGPNPVRLRIAADAQDTRVCGQCTLKYAVYGPHRGCPDCGAPA